MAERVARLVAQAETPEETLRLLVDNFIDALLSYPALSVNVQVGEESVTNPDPGVLPDQFLYYYAVAVPATSYLSYSSLTGGQPVMSTAEVDEFAAAMLAIHAHFATIYGATLCAVDSEFKLDSPNRDLVIKQARPYPCGAL